MAINLSRNTRLFVSTVQTGNTTQNTWEVPVLDGYSFSQDTASQTITLNEAGSTTTRGQKVFNTALNPVEVSLPTYVRPYYRTTAAAKHSCVERVLWEALVGPGSPDASADNNNATINGTNAREGANSFNADFEASNVNELGKIQLFFQVDNTTYLVKDVILTTAEIDFSIDSIAMITWGGSGTDISEVDTTAWAAGTDYVGAIGIAAGTADTEAKFIRNKLSTIQLKSTSGSNAATEGYWIESFAGAIDVTAAHGLTAGANTVDITVDGGSAQTISVADTDGTTIQDVIDLVNYQLTGATVKVEDGDIKIESHTAGTGSSIAIASDLLFSDLTGWSASTGATAGTGTGKVYNVPITGGSLTIENNVTYLTPEELGKVNRPLPGFTGTRSISGSITAYLNSGANNTGGLLTDLASDTTTVTHDFEMSMFMGGETNDTKVKFFMPNCHLTIPSINVEDVISTEITYTALGSDITQADELYVEYTAATA